MMEGEKMNLQELFTSVKLTNIKLNLKFASLDFAMNSVDKDAAWEMYVELITRILTQNLAFEDGDEKTALDSIYSLFPTTRDILKRNGRSCIQFSKIAVVVLNQVVRPFTAKWHCRELHGAFSIPSECENFRADLKKLQVDLRKYSALLARLAEVEDITDLGEIE